MNAAAASENHHDRRWYEAEPAAHTALDRAEPGSAPRVGRGPGLGPFDEAVAGLCVDPAPRGGGRTLRNWRVLARAGADDLDIARLTEAHLDAITILHELDGPVPATGSRWGVWAAESAATGVVRAEALGGAGWVLSGTKPWCSGAGGSSQGSACSHALVTAHADDGRRLFAIDLDDSRLSVREDGWQTMAMPRSAAATVELDRVAATAVGGPRAYLERPGFWHGAIAVAAAWFGGAVAVARPLQRAGLLGRLDAHGTAHLGAVDAARSAARALLIEAAHALDESAARNEPVLSAQRRALQVRAAVENLVDAAVRHTGRGVGPGPLAHDGVHARRVADLTLYVRQSHAERDLAALGELALDDASVL